MNDWTRICRLQDIPVLGSRRVQRPAGMDVALFRNAEDEVFALLDRCPHKGGPLHNWTIGLGNGCAREPDEGCTPAFQVKLDGGEVFLLRAELETLAVDLVAPVAGPKIPIAAA